MTSSFLSKREGLVSLTKWWNLLFIDMDILPLTDTASFTVTLFEHPFLVMDTDFRLQEKGGLVGLSCDRALSKACSLTEARSTWNDILTQTYPQMYVLYKNTLKFLLLSMNMTFKAASFFSKKNLPHMHTLFSLSEHTRGRQDNSVLKTISSLKAVTQAPCFPIQWQ